MFLRLFALLITNNREEPKGNFVRFGRNGSGLADGDRKYFRWKDATNATKLWKVEIDGNGYLHPLIKGTLISLQ